MNDNDNMLYCRKNWKHTVSLPETWACFYNMVDSKGRFKHFHFLSVVFKRKEKTLMIAETVVRLGQLKLVIKTVYLQPLPTISHSPELQPMPIETMILLSISLCMNYMMNNVFRFRITLKFYFQIGVHSKPSLQTVVNYGQWFWSWVHTYTCTFPLKLFHVIHMPRY